MMSHLDSPLLIDKRVVADSFSRAAPRYDSVAHLQRLVAQQMLCWMPETTLSKPLLDLGCGTGFVLEQALLRQPDLSCIGLDIAAGMLVQSRQRLSSLPNVHWLCADAEHLPLADGSVSLVTSNFALQWCANLARALAEIHRVLEVQGRCLLTLPAENTLWELKESWRIADPAHTHVSHFVDETALCLAARQTGLQIGRTARLSRCVYYPDVATLAGELKTLGAHNATGGRRRALTSKGEYRRMSAAYETRRNDKGKLPATWQILLLEMIKSYD